MYDISLNETIYGSSYLIGVSEPGPNVRNITLLALLKEGGALEDLPQKVIDGIIELSIVWKYDNDNSGDILVDYIYDHDTGEVYWEDKDENWSDGDELILNSLLMYGDLESTII